MKFSRLRLPALGFISHAPGLKRFAGHSLSNSQKKLNRWFLAMTMVSAILAAFTADPGNRLSAFLILWLIGHLSWSIVLALILCKQLGGRTKE